MEKMIALVLWVIVIVMVLFETFRIKNKSGFEVVLVNSFLWGTTIAVLGIINS